jgi:transposase-like protein
MPWREICPMDERLRFVAAVLAGDQSMTELCASFGVSRKTGYKWRARCARQGPEGLHDLSPAPHRVPWAITEAQAQAILALRYAHPSWGPKKLHAKLAQRRAQESWPAPSTIGELLQRKGLTQAQAAPPCGSQSRPSDGGGQRQRRVVHRLQRLVPHRRPRAL